MVSFSGPLVFLQCEVSFLMLLSPQSDEDNDDDNDEWTPCVSGFADSWVGDVPPSTRKGHIQSAP